MALEWLTNMYNPNGEYFDNYLHAIEKTREEMLEYLKGKIIGRPKSTPARSVEELEKMDMVGVYRLGEAEDE